MKLTRLSLPLCLSLGLLQSAAAMAVNGSVNMVFYPTVEEGEVEVEARGWRGNDDGAFDGAEVDKFDLAYGVTSWWKTELEFVVEKAPGESREWEATASENFFQLSEQGEYFADFGFFFEYENVRDADIHEVVFGPIIQMSFGDIVATTNLFVEREFGSDAEEKKFEPFGSLQVKYRLAKAFEPAVELYMDEHGWIAGPAALGEVKLAGNKLKWQLAYLLGNSNDDDVADQTLRWAVEYEF
ncbi:hypothetical protein HPT27_02525 [Permianibacter sp. IMCC34836]|uniref:hypothetical protein n=1 Tax=Permianibacter fluminis TaxID=2738515 RepID=UPI001552AA1D|nr:hypothetical protein [Permianibacter fluminis]NQD35880.1 hypothetical protein [Permianibacter fluminis]